MLLTQPKTKNELIKNILNSRYTKFSVFEVEGRNSKEEFLKEFKKYDRCSIIILNK